MLLKAIARFLFPSIEARELDRQFVKENPDAEPFFREQLKPQLPGLVTAADLSSYTRYELWKFIKDNQPQLKSVKRKTKTK